MAKLLALSLITALVGCGSINVDEPEVSSAGDQDRTGVIKYLDAGASFVKAKRRENTYKRMQEKCNGSYEIVKEGTYFEDGVVYESKPSTARYTPTDYVYFEYRCVAR